MDALKPGALNRSSGLDRLEKPEIAKTRKPEEGPSKAVPFSELLENQIGSRPPQALPPGDGLRFSAHAQARLQSRGIDLSSDDRLKLQEAVDRMRDKGSKESLILTDKGAFVVSIKNQTVITALDREGMKDNIFTNIDSTIMI